MADDKIFPCLRCQAAMADLGEMSFVTGGSSGAAKVFLGQWAEMNEKNWTVRVIRCTKCGHVEFYDRSAH